MHANKRIAFKRELVIGIALLFTLVSCGDQSTLLTDADGPPTGIKNPEFVTFDGTKAELLSRPFLLPPGVCGAIGPAGGIVANGPVALIIPAGALPEVTNICISAVSQYSLIAEFSPAGQTFGFSVEMRWNLTGSSAEDQAEDWITLWYNPTTELWEDQVTEEPINSNVTKTYIDHFSKYSGRIDG